MPKISDVIKKKTISNYEVNSLTIHDDTTVLEINETFQKELKNRNNLKDKPASLQKNDILLKNEQGKDIKIQLNNSSDVKQRQNRDKTETHEISKNIKTGNKEERSDQITETKQRQTEDKPKTKQRQIRDKTNQTEPKQRQTEDKTETQTETTLKTNRDDTKTKQRQNKDKTETNISVSELTKLQKILIDFIFNQCLINSAIITKPITSNYISDKTYLTISTVKKTLQRLENSGYLIRYKFKRGRGGWTIYKLQNTIYSEILTETNRRQIEDKSKTKQRQNRDKMETK